MDVPLSWQLAKLVISIGIVLGLSLVAERVSARMAGMLAGYPLGTAIALYFIGLEISPAFATESAVHTLAGFSATLALSAGYLIGARRDGPGWCAQRHGPGYSGLAADQYRLHPNHRHADDLRRHSDIRSPLSPGA